MTPINTVPGTVYTSTVVPVDKELGKEAEQKNKKKVNKSKKKDQFKGVG